MITGIVNDDLEATCHLTVRANQHSLHHIEEVIDTGFTGFLTLPFSLIATLGLPWLCRQEGQLADGSFHTFDVYTITILWDGMPRIVEVEAADADPLLGMELLRGHELRVDVVPGGPVTISQLLKK